MSARFGLRSRCLLVFLLLYITCTYVSMYGCVLVLQIEAKNWLTLRLSSQQVLSRIWVNYILFHLTPENGIPHIFFPLFAQHARLVPCLVRYMLITLVEILLHIIIVVIFVMYAGEMTEKGRDSNNCLLVVFLLFWLHRLVGHLYSSV